MKFIFLDIDGVVNSSRSVIAKIGPTTATSALVRELASFDDNGEGEALEYGAKFALLTVDPVCVALVNRLLEADPSIGLVLSSSHRNFFCHSKSPFGGAEHLRRLRLYLTAMGVNVPEFFSVTGNSHRKRGEEIDEWLNMAWENDLFDDEAYVILDDSSDMLPGQPHVHCNPDYGLSFEDYATACKLLGLKEPGLVLL